MWDHGPDATGMTLGHFDGILFLILFAGYIGLMIKSAMKARAEGKEVEANDEFDAEELKVKIRCISMANAF